MSKGSIRLHPKYGLNPCLGICILCNKETGDIALLGNAYKGEAPYKMVTSIEPCDKCREKYLSVGVMLVRADKDDRGKPVPNGDVLVLKDEAFTRMFNRAIPTKKICYMASEVFDRIYKEYKVETN